MKQRIYLNNDWTFWHEDNPDVKEMVRLPHANVETPFNYFDEHIYQFVSVYEKTVTIPKELKKTLGKPRKIKSTASCNPFDLDVDSTIDTDTLNRYKGYNYFYKNIVVSLTQNKKTGVYYVDGAGPIDLD